MTEQYGFHILHAPSGAAARLIVPMMGWPKRCLTIGAAPDCSVVLTGAGVAPLHARFYHRGHHRYIEAVDGPIRFDLGEPILPGGGTRVDGMTFFLGDLIVRHGALAATEPTAFARLGETALRPKRLIGRESEQRVMRASAALAIPVEDWEAFGAAREVAEALWFDELALADLRAPPASAPPALTEALTRLSLYLEAPDAIARLRVALEKG